MDEKEGFVRRRGPGSGRVEKSLRSSARTWPGGLNGVIGGSAKLRNTDCFAAFPFIGALGGPVWSVQVDVYI